MKVRKIAKSKAQSGLGGRCKEFEWFCYPCEQYRFLDLFGKFPTDAEHETWAEPHREAYIAADTRVFRPWIDRDTRFGKRK